MRRNVLNITASDVKDAKLTATVTIPAADVDAAIKKAYKDTAKKYRFPGFRAGKAPRPVIDSALGAEATLAQATNDLIAANEPAVLNELDIVPTKSGDYKELDLAKDHEDYTYTVEFSLRPAAELSSFDAVEIEMPPAEVTESEINNQVEMLLNYRATFEDVEGRAVEAEDYVTVDLKAVENADNFAAEGRMLIAGSDSNPAEFNEALIGANVDDVKTVTWTDEVEEGEEAETHTVEFLYAVVGEGTRKLTTLKKGDSFQLTGPMGNGFDVADILSKYQKIAVVGGGIGTAPMYQLTRELAAGGVKPDVFFGFRDKPYCMEEYRSIAGIVKVSTDTGAVGFHGFVTQLYDPADYDVVLVCGPTVMMRNAARLCAEKGTPCFVSLEKKMACGIGACLGCTCETRSGEGKSVCKNGPVFDAAEVF